MAVGQVRPLVREHGVELPGIEHGQGGAGEHDRGGAARHAVRGRLRGIEHDGGACAGQPAPGDARGLSVRAGSPLGPLDAAPVPPGQHGQGQRGGDRGQAEAKLEGRAAVDDGRARSAGHRAADGLG